MNAADRFKAALVAIVEELVPDRKFLCPAEYIVDKCEGGKLTAKPRTSARGLPPIVDMPVRGGIAGGMSATKLKKGTSVLVTWIDGSPARPFLAWIDEGEEPDELALEGQSKATIKAPAVKVDASSSFDVDAGAATITASGAATINASGKATVKGSTVELGTAPTGIPTQQTLTALLALLVAERTAFAAFFGTPTVAAISAGTAAPAAAATAAVNVALAAAPTLFSQTVKAGA